MRPWGHNFQCQHYVAADQWCCQQTNLARIHPLKFMSWNTFFGWNVAIAHHSHEIWQTRRNFATFQTLVAPQSAAKVFKCHWSACAHEREHDFVLLAACHMHAVQKWTYAAEKEPHECGQQVSEGAGAGGVAGSVEPHYIPRRLKVKRLIIEVISILFPPKEEFLLRLFPLFRTYLQGDPSGWLLDFVDIKGKVT